MTNHIKGNNKSSKNAVRTEKNILGSALLISVLCIMTASALMINDAETNEAAGPGEVGYEFTVDYRTYKITKVAPNGTVELTDCNAGITGHITINTVTYKSTGYTITSIDDYAFQYCTGLTSVEISASVTSIGSYAFYGCTKLTTVTIPDSVIFIGYSVFYGCTALESISVNKSNMNYSSVDGVLYNKNKTNLMWYPAGKTGAFEIPASVTSIGNYAFQYCTGLTSLTIPDSVETIGGYGFNGCTSLTSVTISNGVGSIGGYGFNGCTALTFVTIPASVKTIGTSAFGDCTGLTSVEISNGVTSIGSYAFYGCTKLTTVTIPVSVTSIGTSAFRDCTGLTSVTISNGVTSIGNYAFYGCTKLTTVTIPVSVTSIGNYAFYGCTKLTTVTIPVSVTSIGNYTFRDCTGLTRITFEGTSVPALGSGSFGLGTESEPVDCDVYSSLEGKFLDGYKNGYTTFTYFYSVIYKLNGGAGEPPAGSDKAAGAEFNAASAIGITAPAGKQFGKWNTKADGSGTSYAAGADITMPASALTLYATWENIPMTYAVTYELNGGTGTAPTESDKAAGAKFNAASAIGITAPEGTQFKEWNTETGGGGASYPAGADITMPASALTLYATWEDIPVTDIIGVPGDTTVEKPLTLTGTVVPSNAANKTIVWTVISGDATISDDILTVDSAGSVTVRATIKDGTNEGDYTKDFVITASDVTDDDDGDNIMLYAAVVAVIAIAIVAAAYVFLRGKQ